MRLKCVLAGHQMKPLCLCTEKCLRCRAMKVDLDVCTACDAQFNLIRTRLTAALNE